MVIWVLVNILKNSSYFPTIYTGCYYPNYWIVLYLMTFLQWKYCFLCVKNYRRVINSPLFSLFTSIQPQTNQNKWIQDIYVNSETIKTNVAKDQLTTTISRHRLTLSKTVSAIKDSLDCLFCLLKLTMISNLALSVGILPVIHYTILHMYCVCFVEFLKFTEITL